MLSLCVCVWRLQIELPNTHTHPHTDNEPPTHSQRELESVLLSWTLCWLSNCFIFISFACQATICWAFAIMMIYGRKLFLGRTIYDYVRLDSMSCLPACFLRSLWTTLESGICRPPESMQQFTNYNFNFSFCLSLSQSLCHKLSWHFPHLAASFNLKSVSMSFDWNVPRAHAPIVNHTHRSMTI